MCNELYAVYVELDSWTRLKAFRLLETKMKPSICMLVSIGAQIVIRLLKHELEKGWVGRGWELELKLTHHDTVPPTFVTCSNSTD